MRAFLLVIVSSLAGCGPVSITTGDTISPERLETFFRTHKVGRAHAVALKKRSLGDVSYLVTVHGYSNNLSVCEELIAPYNKNSSLSVIPGSYFCEELH